MTDAQEYSGESIENKMKGTIFSKDDLTINGEGSLKVKANYKHGIQGKNDLLLISGNIEVESVGNAIVGKDSVMIKDANLVIHSEEKGIKATSTEAEKGYVYIENATVDITAQDDGIHSDTVVQMDGGTVTISSKDDGVHADVKVLINGGMMDVTDSYEGIEATMITMNDGDVNIHSSDDGINVGNGLNTEMEMGGGFGKMKDERSDMENNTSDHETGRMKGKQRQQNMDGEMPQMPDGEMPQMPDGEMPEMPDGETPQMPDGEMSQMPSDQQGFGMKDNIQNSSDNEEKSALAAIDEIFTMNGGRLYINAGGDGLDSNNIIVMTGGTIIIDGPENNEKIVIKDAKGNEVVSYTPVKKFNSFVYSSEKLKTGETYTIYAGDEEIDSFTISGTITNVGNGGGFGGGFEGNGMMRGGRR